MTRISRLAGAFALAAVTMCAGFAAQAQAPSNVVVTNALNADGPNVAAARLRRPATDALGRAHIGIFVMHPYSGYQNSNLCDGLSRRGFTTLCADSTFNGRPDDYYGYEQHAPAMRAGIDYLRGIAAAGGLPAVTRVLIFGHSMGAPMMGFYQNVAENGAGFACQGREKIIPCVDTNLAHLPRADGVMLFDPHLGDSLATFTYVDPALTSTTECVSRVERRDMFAASNGYITHPGALDNNSASYSEPFKREFFFAQSIRNAAILIEAQALLARRRIETRNPRDMGDDIPFVVAGATGARLFQPDTGLMRSTQRPHTLLARDGTRPMQVVSSVRPPSGNAAAADCANSTIETNVHVWLGSKALRSNPFAYKQAENDLQGVDYESSATSTVTGVSGIGRNPTRGQNTTPLLIIANSGHYFLRPAEIIYDKAFSRDKTVAYSEGAVHGGTACAACTRIILNDPALGTTAANAYWTDPAGNGPLERSLDFMAEWLDARF